MSSLTGSAGGESFYNVYTEQILMVSTLNSLQSYLSMRKQSPLSSSPRPPDLESHLHLELPHCVKDQLESVKEMRIDLRQAFFFSRICWTQLKGFIRT